MNKKITFEDISSKLREYQMEIIFIIVLIIFASLARTIFNFILDYRIVLVIIAILWYLGYMNRIQQLFKEKISKINYFKTGSS
jgi:uncharacterized membrane protein (DUF4010 family)